MARSKDTTAGPTYYTTHQVAKLLGVSLPTVVNWVKADRLAAHRTPGGHRRIAQKEVLGFARANHYPVPKELCGDSKPRVLVIDDEADFSEMIADYLQLKGGVAVSTASSAFEAGYRLASFGPDLVLMDMMMPAIDGIAVREWLGGQPDTRHVQVIACLSYRDPALEERIMVSHFHGLLDKPLKLDALLTLVRKCLGLDG